MILFNEIRANDFSRQWADLRDDAVAAFAQTGASGWYILGREVKVFEDALARYWGLAHVVGVASGLDALEISLRVLGCKAGDKVLTTSVSAFATTLAIVKLGATPVYIDVDRYGLADLSAAREALRRDPSIRYFVPVHLYGHALNLAELRKLRDEFGIAIVEDCAQSIGASWRGESTGSVGQMAATSFYPTKNLGAMGDAGAILTDSPEMAAKARVLRDYGQDKKYQHGVIGYNSRLDEMQASLLRCAGMPRLERWTKRRREVAARYIEGLQNAQVRVPGAPPGSDSCWHLFPVLIAPEHKAGFMAHLSTRGICAGEHYPVSIPEQTAMKGVPFQIASEGIERAQLFCRSEVSLPIHPYLTDAEVATVIQAVNAWQS